LLVRFPIWCFLVYVMLKAANPDRLVWFLFFVYVPIGFLNIAIGIIINLTMRKEVQAQEKNEVRL
jgi:hypothetical protein